MPVYSHSRISTFEQCPLRFKYNYIDKIKTEVENTIEAFMGSMVHDTLEQLYKDLKFQKLNTLNELLDIYNKLWKENFSSGIKVIRKEYTAENYRQMGEKFISDYYETYKPFDQEKTILLEGRIMVKIGNRYLQGYIDRLTSDSSGTYYIRDYKTANTLPTQEKADADRQLALYAIAIKEAYKDCKKIVLVWHYLAFDKEVRSERTDAELEELKKEIEKGIEKIESCTDFPAKESALCGWCQFQSLCPRFKHKFELKKDNLNKYIEDDGVKLVDKLEKVEENLKMWEAEKEELKEAILEFAKKEGVSVIFGTEKKASINSYNKMSFPKKDDPIQEKFFEVVKQIGLWDELAMVDVYSLTKMINRHEVHEDLVKLLDKFISKSEVTSMRLLKK